MTNWEVPLGGENLNTPLATGYKRAPPPPPYRVRFKRQSRVPPLSSRPRDDRRRNAEWWRRFFDGRVAFAGRPMISRARRQPARAPPRTTVNNITGVRTCARGQRQRLMVSRESCTIYIHVYYIITLHFYTVFFCIFFYYYYFFLLLSTARSHTTSVRRT